MNIKGKLIKFMYGRYGVDQLYNFLFGLYIFLFFINFFLNFEFLNYIIFLIIFIMFYRVFSKNIYKRSKENQIYLKCKNSFFSPFRNIKRNFKDRKKYVYKKCNNCKTTLRLPLPEKRGINRVKCPDCRVRLVVFTLRQKRIVIIRKK